ncbi:MAG: carbohydrate ABC transporter permease, partial [Acidimicrobiales bacterium]
MSLIGPTAVATEVRAEPRVSHDARAPRPRSRFVLYLLMAVVLVIYLYPLVFLVNTALKSDAEFFANPTGLVGAPELSNFATAWQKGNFAAYLLNSVLYT